MGYVYLLGEWGKDNIYKIGVTRGKIENRIKKLQTGNSNEIYLISNYETEYPFLMEKMLHIRYNDKKVLNEWFELNDKDVLKFKDACKEIEETIKVLKSSYFFNKLVGKNKNEDNY